MQNSLLVSPFLFPFLMLAMAYTFPESPIVLYFMQGSLARVSPTRVKVRLLLYTETIEFA